MILQSSDTIGCREKAEACSPPRKRGEVTRSLAI